MKCYMKDYPRPQFVRRDWLNLNGTWDFCFDEENKGEKEKWFEEFPCDATIQVPFTYETKQSGIQNEKPCTYIWYKKDVLINAEMIKGKDTVLHFEGSDYITKVWVNGIFVGEHEGGYSRFSFDITDYVSVNENNKIVVKVEDDLSNEKPRGKQRWVDHNFGCWYIQTTGIWKTVWLEFMNETNIKQVKMTSDYENLSMVMEYDIESDVYGEDLVLETRISFQGTFIKKHIISVDRKKARIAISLINDQIGEWKVHTWRPKNPNLYDVEFVLSYKGQVLDEVGSYFGFRKIGIQGNKVLLNDEPLYQRLILDQGYWEDSHLTPPSEEALIEDIDKILELGYNGVRKHQKIEDERFLYWCDVKGVLVWSEMAATYVFNDDAVECFANQWLEIVRQNYNHPSIITWVPFNESWGVAQIKNHKLQQKFTEAIYHLTKSIDPYRPVIVNDGWEHTVSDIITLHDYEEKGESLLERYADEQPIVENAIAFNKHKYAFANGYGYKGQPIIISEFGGIAFSNKGEGWGYGNKVEDEEKFVERFDSITSAIKKLPYVCGYCYTQVTDVQQEVNGLMDIKRQFKVDPETIRVINTK